MENTDDDIQLISIDKLDYGTIRVIIKIKGCTFKRLFHPSYPVVWNDQDCTFNDCLAMTPEQEKDLEGIFIAWMKTNNTNVKLLTEQ
jgi:hypothetical protein